MIMNVENTCYVVHIIIIYLFLFLNADNNFDLKNNAINIIKLHEGETFCSIIC